MNAIRVQNVDVLNICLDVPDPPENVILSEHNGRSVKLLWISGDDHNSSITGKMAFLHIFNHRSELTEKHTEILRKDPDV